MIIFFLQEYLFSSASFLSPSAAGAPASLPSAAAASSVSTSTGFSGSFTTVGAANVAITKSRPIIVGATPSSNLTEDILKLSPISTPSRSITIASGIFSLGHFNSIFLLTIFRTPPLFKPGDVS